MKEPGSRITSQLVRNALALIVTGALAALLYMAISTSDDVATVLSQSQ